MCTGARPPASEFPEAVQRGTPREGLEATFCLIRQVYARAGAALAEARHGSVGQQKVAEIAAECLEQFRRDSGIAAALIVAPDWQEQPFSPMARVQLKHILREALNNVRRHAAATHVAVSLAIDEGLTHICVADDGRGFCLSRVLPQFLSPSYPRRGLPTMRDHARAAGGTFRVESSPGRGTRIVLWVPPSGSR